MHRRLVMVGGSFNGETPEDVERNLVATELLGFAAIQAGAACIVPNSWGRRWQDAPSHDVMVGVTLSILQRCDALLVTPDWRRESGTRREVAFAHDHGIRVLVSIEELRQWLREPPADRRFLVTRT